MTHDQLGQHGAVVPTSPPRYGVHVLSISWERVLLTIHVRVEPTVSDPVGNDSPLTFEIFTPTWAHPLEASRASDGTYLLEANVTTFVDRRAIPQGTWRIRAVVDGQPGGVAQVEASQLTELDAASRVFLFNSNRNAYTVSFGISDSDEHLEFLMRTYEFANAPAPARRRHALRRLRRNLVGTPAKRRYLRWIYAFCVRWIGPKKGRILFASEQRPAIEGNLKRVQERMVERGLADQFDIHYSFRLPATAGSRSNLRLHYLLATSEVVLLDDYFEMLNNLDVDRRTKIIQLWHAGSGFKSVGFSRFGQAGSPMLKNAHRSYTFAITGSRHLVPVYAEAFGIEPEAVIATGLPRVDWFLDEERTRRFTDEFFADYPALQGKRIILFAPTFRGRGMKSAYYDFDLIDFESLYDACGDDTVVLFRMHHFVNEKVPIPAEFADRFFDFTSYPKGLELLHVTDLMITDYSSIIYEYSLLDRPMLFFAPDRANYAATRGFHRDFDETAPGRVCDTFSEVVEAIRAGEFEQSKVATFREENFDRVDTGSADRVIDWLILADPRDPAKRTGRRAPAALDYESDAEQDEGDNT